MSKERLAKWLEEARSIIENDGTAVGYAKAFGYLEVGVENYLNEGGDEVGEQEQAKK